MDGVELDLAQQRNPDLVAERVCMGHPVQPDFVLAAASGHAGAQVKSRSNSFIRRPGASSTILSAPCVGRPPRDLLQHVGDEQRVVDQVAVSEPTRLRHQPEQPFQPRALHPDRCAWLRAGMEVERRAYADQRSSFDLAEMLDHPLFLLWHAEPDPDEVRTGFVDGRDVLDVLGGGQGPVRRRAVARDDQARMAPAAND